MKTTLPWYAWYPADFLNSTRGWSLLQKGAYREALDTQWAIGGIPAEPEEFRSAIGASAKEWPAIWRKLAPKFPVDADGLRRNPRLGIEQAKGERIRTERSEYGRRGAEARYGKSHGKSHSKSQAKAMATACPPHSQSHSEYVRGESEGSGDALEASPSEGEGDPGAHQAGEASSGSIASPRFGPELGAALKSTAELKAQFDTEVIRRLHGVGYSPDQIVERLSHRHLTLDQVEAALGKQRA